jgi:hypothetical protein
MDLYSVVPACLLKILIFMTSLDFAGCVCVDLAPMTPISKKKSPQPRRI